MLVEVKFGKLEVAVTVTIVNELQEEPLLERIVQIEKKLDSVGSDLQKEVDNAL